MDDEPTARRLGIVDFPSVWNQKARKGMNLHWDGNNCSVDERNLSAGFGTGATPATLDRPRLLRIADWLWTEAKPPAMPANHIDRVLAAQGEPVYREYCQSCHGTREPPFRQPGDGGKVGEVTPLEQIGTDRFRLDSYTLELAQAQNSLYAGSPPQGEDACREYIDSVCNPNQDDAKYRALRDRCYPSRFSHFRKTYGYANMPLDGLWLRAPYLHNGSVPTLRALLEPKERRPTVLYIGYDVYDFENVGFVTSGPDAEQRGWRLDTFEPANGNGGHEGAQYGTDLTPGQKAALIEYLKTF
jgi:RoxA-like, cytochrome c-like